MCIVYTSRISYVGPDRLDITVKDGSEWGPTWEMVMGTKKGTMTEAEYTEKYYELMRAKYRAEKGHFQRICDMESVTFCCYCAAGAFCHRYLLADIFVKLGCTYGGER